MKDWFRVNRRLVGWLSGGLLTLVVVGLVIVNVVNSPGDPIKPAPVSSQVESAVSKPPEVSKEPESSESSSASLETTESSSSEPSSEESSTTQESTPTGGLPSVVPGSGVSESSLVPPVVPKPPVVPVVIPSTFEKEKVERGGSYSSGSGSSGSGSGTTAPLPIVVDPLPIVPPLEAGGTLRLPLSISTPNTTVTVATDNDHVTVVVAEGAAGKELVITGDTPGTTTVTVTISRPGYAPVTMTFTVTIVEAKKITLLPFGDISSLLVGESTTVPVVLSPPNAAVTASSSSANVQVVSASGTTLSLKGIAAGKSTITVTATLAGYPTVTTTFSVTVVAKDSPISLGALGDIGDLVVGATASVPVVVTPTDAVVTATSSSGVVSVVSADNTTVLLKGNSAGTAVITLRATKAGYTPATVSFRVICSDAPVVPLGSREVFNFNTDWVFAKGVGENNSQSKALPAENVVVIPASEQPYAVDYAPDTRWSNVSLPHTYNDVDTLNNFMEGSHWGERSMYTGTSWYKKTFVVPAEYSDKKVFVEFEAARQAAHLYINGTKLVGTSENGFIPFGYDLTDHILFGQENQITVMVDNSFPYYAEGTVSDILSWHDSHWHPTHGGLYRNANLYITDKLHVTLPLYSFLETQGTYVYTENESAGSAGVKIETEMKNDYGEAKTFTLTTQVVGQDGGAVATVSESSLTLGAGEKQVFKQSTTVTDPVLWSDQYPYLYQVVSTVELDGVVVDTTETPLGIRTFRMTNDYGVFLNENYVKLQGWGQKSTSVWAGLGAAYPDWMHDMVMKLMKDAGGNFVRWGHTAGSPTQIDLSDKYGLIVLQPGVDGEGSTVGGSYSETAYRVRSDAFRDLIIYYRNNPSIFLWELGNQSMPAREAKALSDLITLYDHHGRTNDIRENSGSYDDTVASSQRLRAVRRGDATMVPYVDVGITTEGTGGMETAALGRKPAIEGEYDREEARRGVWDKYTPGYENFQNNTGTASYKYLNSESFAANQVREYAKLGAVKHGGGANWIFSDSTSHGRIYSEVTRASGEVDAVMLPKEAYHALSTIFTDEVDAHIIGHWNYPSGTVKDVFVASDAYDVELFLNGTSLGKGTKTNEYLFTFKNVSYTHGTLKAVGTTKAGAEVCTAEITTHGEPAALRLTPIVGPQGLLANGSDVLLLDVDVVDASGNLCLTYDGVQLGNYANFAINDSNGASVWRGGYNSGIEDTTNHKYLYIENGQTRVSVRTTMVPGDITVTVSAAGLTSDTVTETSHTVENSGGLSQVRNETPDYSLNSLTYQGWGTGAKPDETVASDNVYRSLLIDNFNYSNATPEGATPHVASSAGEGANPYIKNGVTFGHLPIELLNSDYVMMNNEDNGYQAEDLTNFNLGVDADLYIAHDDRVLPRPLWLTDTKYNFADTGEKLIIDGQTYSLFHKAAPKGTPFSLGGNGNTTEEGLLGNMYLVFAKEQGKSHTFFEDDFEQQELGLSPAGWLTQEAEDTWIRVVNDIPDRDGSATQAVQFNDRNKTTTNNMAVISKEFLPQRGLFSFEWDLYDLRNSSQNYVRFFLSKGAPSADPNVHTGTIVETYLMTGGKLAHRHAGNTGTPGTIAGSTILSANKWYHIKYIVDMDNKTFDVYLDGTLTSSGNKFRNNLDFSDHIIMGTGGGTFTDMAIDNVKVEILENRLKTITAYGCEITTFDKNETALTLTLPDGTDLNTDPGLAVTPMDTYAKVDITPSTDGHGTATVKVTAMNGDVRTITIAFSDGGTPPDPGTTMGQLWKDDFEAGTVDSQPTDWLIEAAANTSGLIALDGANQHLQLLDTNTTSGTRTVFASRSFAEQDEKMELEYALQLKNNTDQYIRVLLNKGASHPTSKDGFLIETYVHQGNLVYRDSTATGTNKNIKTGLPLNTWVKVKYLVDFEAQTFEVYLDGVKEGGSYAFRNPGTVTTADHVILGTGAGSVGNVWFDDVVVSGLVATPPVTDFLDEDFETGTVGAVPAGWIVTAGTGTSGLIDTDPDDSLNKVLKLADASANSVVVAKSFAPQTENFVAEWRMRIPAGDAQFMRILLHDGAPTASGKDKFLIETYVHQGNLVYRDSSDTNKTIVTGLPIASWMALQYHVNFGTQTFEVYLDGNKQGGSYAFRNPSTVTKADHLIFGTGGSATFKGEMLLDDVKISPLVTTPDKILLSPAITELRVEDTPVDGLLQEDSRYELVVEGDSEIPLELVVDETQVEEILIGGQLLTGRLTTIPLGETVVELRFVGGRVVVYTLNLIQKPVATAPPPELPVVPETPLVESSTLESSAPPVPPEEESTELPEVEASTTTTTTTTAEEEPGSVLPQPPFAEREIDVSSSLPKEEEGEEAVRNPMPEENQLASAQEKQLPTTTP